VFDVAYVGYKDKHIVQFLQWFAAAFRGSRPGKMVLGGLFTIQELVFYVLLLAAGLFTGRIMKMLASKKKGQQQAESGSSVRTAPSPPAGLPLLGHAVALGQRGTEYLAACKQEVGSSVRGLLVSAPGGDCSASRVQGTRL
jgi:hypothetical protein